MVVLATIYHLFSILKFNFIHFHSCFYNVWIYPRSHSAMKTIRAPYRKFYFDFPSLLLAYSTLRVPLTLPVTSQLPLTQVIPCSHTHLPLFHCYLLLWRICFYLWVQVRTRSNCNRCSWRPWRDRSTSCLGSRPSWGNGKQRWKHPGLTFTSLGYAARC